MKITPLKTRGTRRLLQLAIALVVGVIGVGGFFLVIPHTTVQSTKLDEFVVANPKISDLVDQPNQFTGVVLSRDPSPSIVAAAAEDPAHTGAFSIEWFANGRDGTSLDIYLETMPMLSKEDNELITQTDRGTPMGELFRRFWIPALLSEELPGSRLQPGPGADLGEDLVAFATPRASRA
jgi:hypothetical protein